MPADIAEIVAGGGLPIIVTDPPFNIGFKYDEYSDKMPEAEYYKMLADLTSLAPSVIIHRPEALHRLSIEKREAPTRVVSWVYNSNTPRQHRDIAFYGVTPDFKKVGQPYKNPNDKRIQKRIAEGKRARLYDWWEINQVKNTSAEKTAHPCQMPAEVMRRIIGTLPDCVTVFDPFMGSGSTGVACKEMGVPFYGYEISAEYYEIARARVEGD